MLKDIDIKDNLLIICPSDYKLKLLKEFNDNKLLLNVSFLSIGEYKRNYYFDYDYKAIKYLVDNYQLSVSNASEILENLYYVEDKDYKNNKLNDLVKYKKELNNLLIYNPLFKNYISNKHIIVAGYGKLDELTKSMFADDTTFIEYTYKDKHYDIKKAKDIEIEVEHVYNSIFELLKSGVDINKIYLLNVADEYSFYIKRYNTYYPFKINYKSNDSLYGLDITKQFLNRLDNKQDLYKYLVSSNSEYVNNLINIINKYCEYDDLNEVRQLIIEDLKNTHLSNNYSDVIKCVNMFTDFDDDEHVFFLGFNDLIPTMKKDTSYITDNIRHLVNMEGIEQDNKLIKENTINYLSNINNLYLSYSESTPFNSHNKQILFNDVTYIDIVNDNKHSDSLNKYKYSKMLDDLNKYGSLDSDIDDMYATYGVNDYATYDNSYKKFDAGIKDVDLSYSSMNSYYECGFKYYLNKVLRVDKYDDSFYTFSGGVIHYVLSKLVENSSLDFDTLWDEGIELERYKPQTSNEVFFMNKMKDEIKQDFEVIKDQKVASSFTDVECEKEVRVKLNNHTKFNGKIDKILKDKDNVCVIDYKTGDNKIESELFEYGLSLQLPSYLFLLKNSKEYKDSKVIGFYLQHLINKDNKYDSKKTLDEVKAESLKLNGFTNSDDNNYTLIDNELEPGGSSSVVRSLRLTKEGKFYSNNYNVISDKEIDDLVKLVEAKILEASDNITNSNFDINPKRYDNKDKSCTYCEYKDICYKRINNYVDFIKKVDKKKEDE